MTDNPINDALTYRLDGEKVRATMITRVVQCPFDFFGARCVYAVKTDKGEYMTVDDVRNKGEGYRVYRMNDRCRMLCEMVHTAETLSACKDYIQRNA